MEHACFTEWQPAFSVGHSLLDAQHKRLFELCQEAACHIDDETPTGLAKFRIILDQLADYVNEHFRSEEALLRKHGYPLLDRHKEEHLNYQFRLANFLLAAALGEVDKASVVTCLANWWAEHILGSDKQYASTLQALSPSQDESSELLDISLACDSAERRDGVLAADTGASEANLWRGVDPESR